MKRQPAYSIIKNDIMGKIAAGVYAPGERIPTEAEFMKAYDVSRITVQRALSELKQQGLLVSRLRAGTFVTQPTASAVLPMTAGGAVERIKIGVVVPFDMTIKSPYQYLDGIMSALSAPRDSVVLYKTGTSLPQDRAILENCLKDSCSGIIYYPDIDQTPPWDMLIQMSIRDYPCVLLDKCIPSVELPSVQSDNEEGGYVLTRHLIERGHRNIVFLVDDYTSSVYDRFKGFCRAMREAALCLPEDVCCRVQRDHVTEQTYEELLKTWQKCGATAVFCCSDTYAKPLLDTCGRLGIDVPGQLAIGGFDGIYPGEITSMLQPYRETGRLAAEMLLEQIMTGRRKNEVVKLKTVLTIGKTT